jgi:hypothetical protein
LTTAGTDAVTRSLAATFFPDLRREITLNDAIDFLHAVVPVTFCDAVLLDGATHDLVERARRQYPGVRMAATFSGRGDGIKRFLAHLASGQRPRRAAGRALGLDHLAPQVLRLTDSDVVA